VRRVRLVLACLALLAAGACVRVPDEGPVRDAPQPTLAAPDEGFPFEPARPQRGETPSEIARHFLEAMMANPIQLSTAREFLTEQAQETWKPEDRTITYPGPISPTGEVTITVDLGNAHWLNSRGRWQGDLPTAERRLTLPMGREAGEWRISDVPDAMIVLDSFFEERFQQVNLYFFDPSGEILVPEPVFVPRGSQLPTSLVRGLLQGPPDAATGSTASFFPRGSELADVSVTVDKGVAEVALRGDLASTSPESLDLMAAQLAWTLRQDPSVATVLVTIGGAPVTLPGGLTEFPVTVGARFDPTGAGATTDLFGLRNGRLVVVADGEPVELAGPLGQREYGVRDVSVDLHEETVVAVTNDGTRLLQAPVREVSGRGPRVVVGAASDLAHPAWDAAGRVWLLDRRPSGALVSVLSGGRQRQVRVPGVTGRDVVDMVVSRDGTRLIAAFERPDGDQVAVSRLTWSTRGVQASRAVVIEQGAGRDIVVRDLSWRTPTELLVLTSLSRTLSEVRTVSVDGSPATERGASPAELIRSDVRRLVSSPLADSQNWVVARDGSIIELAPLTAAPVPAQGLTALTYAG
jgi:hypothetical protein